MKKGKILITGAAGFIGTNIFEHLKNKGYDVYGVDFDMIDKKDERMFDINLIEDKRTEELFNTINPEFILHLAAFTGPQRNEDMKLETCPHFGGVSIGNDVEIGSNTSILPGLLNDTVIDDGTKISSQVYIGSSMQIGKNCMITGKTYFGGSSILEDNVYIGPGSNIRNGITISKNSFVGMGSNVVKDVTENLTVVGNPSKPISHNFDTNYVGNIK